MEARIKRQLAGGMSLVALGFLMYRRSTSKKRLARPTPHLEVIHKRSQPKVDRPLRDRVDEASWESFPASDPPSY